MSKKIAAGSDAIVLDVKTGDGAFMKTKEDSIKLAKAMVKIGNAVGRKTMAIISDMDQPLGAAIGNALEVKEAIETLQGNGPEDLTELCLTLGSQMVVVAGHATTLEEAREQLKEVIANGKALDVFKQFVKAQGGNPAVADDPSLLPQAKYKVEVPAKQAGFIGHIVANEIGTAAMLLGAGRATKESEIDLAVGLMLHKKVGDAVEEGDSLVTIYANREDVQEVIEKIYANISIVDTKPAIPALIEEVITE